MSDAVFTIVSGDYDLKNVKDIKALLVESHFPIIFPVAVICKCNEDELIIRALDDFPYKSKRCKGCGTYLIKLVKVENGKQEIL